MTGWRGGHSDPLTTTIRREKLSSSSNTSVQQQKPTLMLSNPTPMDFFFFILLLFPSQKSFSYSYILVQTKITYHSFLPRFHTKKLDPHTDGCVRQLSIHPSIFTKYMRIEHVYMISMVRATSDWGCGYMSRHRFGRFRLCGGKIIPMWNFPKGKSQNEGKNSWFITDIIMWHPHLSNDIFTRYFSISFCTPTPPAQHIPNTLETEISNGHWVYSMVCVVTLNGPFFTFWGKLW